MTPFQTLQMPGRVYNTGLGGTITDALSKAPIEGIGVFAQSQSTPRYYNTSSGTGGGYELGVPTGTYRMDYQQHSSSFATPTAPFGYGSFDGLVTVEDGAALSGVNVELMPNGRISGTVSTLTDGALVPEPSLVKVVDRDTDKIFGAYAGDDGQYFVNVPPGSYSVSFDKFSTGTGADTDGIQFYDRVSKAGDATPVRVKAAEETKTINGVFGAAVDSEEPQIIAGAATVTGTPALGSTLTVTPGTWTPSNVNLTYKWFRNGQEIGGQTASSYALTTADVGLEISAWVSGTRDGHVPAGVSTPKVGPVIDPNPGSVTVTAVDANKSKQTGVFVALVNRNASHAAQTTQTDSSGIASFSKVPAGEYVVHTYPVRTGQKAGSAFITVAPSAETATTVAFGAVASLPENVTIEGSSIGWNGLTSIPARQNLDFTVEGAPDAVSAKYTVTQGDKALATGALEEESSGTYSAVIPALAVSGEITITATLEYATGGPVTIEIEAYIDPSGTVVDRFGTPVVGAIAELTRSDTETGTFTAIPDGSMLMSPRNRTNPSVTDSAGYFGWDVVPGWYKVQATRGTATVLTAAMPVPPEQLNLVLALPDGAAPAPTTAPQITGKRTVGEALTVATGAWPSFDGDLAPIEVRGYQWARDGAPIQGATGSSYTLTKADSGKVIDVVLTMGRNLTADAGEIVSWQYSVNGANTSALAALPVTGSDGVAGSLAVALALIALGGLALGGSRLRRTMRATK
ncbi:hypothetical protein [Diaminobutyricimonas sp. LJ205]|uniref:hypothetical protein n=1 Tax=Diaminobutyricimonas sp. LJ205 TaxID=2683590 RepID=UPI0012F4F0B0|nr:hypothetical protein [Diaminobutyricimonas sp. LJ205]